MSETNRPRHRQSPSFFRRDEDGSVRVRLRFEAELASLIEEAAGTTPLMVWIYRNLEGSARRDIEAARRRRPAVAPPAELHNAS